MFEDLELPDLERKRLREIPAARLTKRKGYRQVGIRVRLDKRRTVRAKLRRRLATGRRRARRTSRGKTSRGSRSTTTI